MVIVKVLSLTETEQSTLLMGSKQAMFLSEYTFISSGAVNLISPFSGTGSSGTA